MKTIFLIFTLFATIALAYIPSSQFIFDRTAELHGKGAYKIVQELTFKGPSETQIVRETWTIVDGGEMLVQAAGEEFQMTRLLKRGRIYWADTNGNDQSVEVPVDYYMPALIIRNSTELKKFFFKWGALPPEALREKYTPRDLKQLKIETEKFVRLGRVNGTVQYQFGQTDGAALWIEQDQFFVTKMRAPSGAEFLGQDYIIFSRGFAYPKTQSITFGANKVDIKTLSVVAINLTADMKKQFEPAAFRGREDINVVWPKHSLASLVQDFYKRFR